MCVHECALSLLLVRLAVCMLLRLPPDAYLGMTEITHMLKQLQVHPTRFPYSSDGRKREVALKANRPLFSWRGCKKNLGLKTGNEVLKASEQASRMNTGGSIKHLCPWGRLLPSGRRYIHNRWNEAWAQFFKSPAWFKKTLVYHAPAMMTRSLCSLLP